LNASITVTELGRSVLTLSEVLLTFERDSAMFNIKVPGEIENPADEYRTVVLSKTKVEVDGKDNLIIMIRDVTDKVRLEQYQLK
jgi:hypothetical protein